MAQFFSRIFAPLLRDTLSILNVLAICAIVAVFGFNSYSTWNSRVAELEESAEMAATGWLKVALGEINAKHARGDKHISAMGWRHITLAADVANITRFAILRPDGTEVIGTQPAGGDVHGAHAHHHMHGGHTVHSHGAHPDHHGAGTPNTISATVPNDPHAHHVMVATPPGDDQATAPVIKIPKEALEGKSSFKILYSNAGQYSYTDHASGEVLDGKPADDKVYIEAFLPIEGTQASARFVNIVIDVTNAKMLFLETFWRSFLMTGVLAALGVATSTATIFLIRRKRASDAQIIHLARHDPLTNLANRAELSRRLSAMLDEAKAGSSKIALHMIDLDGFKTINDTLGHETGDSLLRAVAGRLDECASPADVTARLGGDEFALVQKYSKFQTVQQTAELLVHSLRSIKTVDGVHVSISASVGTALSAQTTENRTLRQFADAALYRAKRGGKDQQIVFEPGMEAEVLQRNALCVAIRNALDCDGFDIHYQPLHDARDGALSSFEALVRLPDKDGSFVSPGIFIPVAEEMGVTHELGDFVLRKACAEAVDWPIPLRLSVNLSPQQFDSDIVGVVKDALGQSGLNPGRLELEITENLFIENPEPVGAKLHELKALGVRVVMDDFGIGYSSLQQLWKFPFDKLKVDRSCFLSLGESESVAEILRTISAMSGAMNLRVTAEGIETEHQRAFAAEAGYDELQGFLFSKPLPASAVVDYIVEKGGGGNGSVRAALAKTADGTPSGPIATAKVIELLQPPRSSEVLDGHAANDRGKAGPRRA
ncbi:MAG: EAL domain-containing protein [Pseudomonadota bacterium]